MTKRNSRPMFGGLGRDGLKMVEYLGKLPVTFGPFVTTKKYKFTKNKNPRLVDLRDLTLLTKAAGREKLRDVNAPTEPSRPRRVKPPKVEKKTKPVEEPVKEVSENAVN